MSYYDKDKVKFSVCDKLISRGATGSSSDKYSKDSTLLNFSPNSINTTSYTNSDVVGISVNGKRPNRKTFDKELVDLAIEANVFSFVTDNSYNRNRYFNIGEREIAQYLIDQGYTFIDNTERGYWTKQQGEQ